MAHDEYDDDDDDEPTPIEHLARFCAVLLLRMSNDDVYKLLFRRRRRGQGERPYRYRRCDDMSISLAWASLEAGTLGDVETVNLAKHTETCHNCRYLFADLLESSRRRWGWTAAEREAAAAELAEIELDSRGALMSDADAEVSHSLSDRSGPASEESQPIADTLTI